MPMKKRKVFSFAKPPVYKPEVIKGVSLCDKLADEPLESIVKRYLATGQQFPYSHEQADMELTNETTADDIDGAFDDFASADVARMSGVERAECAFNAKATLERERKQAVQARTKQEGQQKHPKEKEPSHIEGVQKTSTQADLTA